VRAKGGEAKKPVGRLKPKLKRVKKTKLGQFFGAQKKTQQQLDAQTRRLDRRVVPSITPRGDQATRAIEVAQGENTRKGTTHTWGGKKKGETGSGGVLYE